jgi:mannose-6-phosphate isomerase-like protein (cupin superfamily)
MFSRPVLKAALALSVAIPTAALAQDATVPLADRIAVVEPAEYNELTSVHGGPGTMAFAGLFDARRDDSAQFNLGTNMLFLHRGVIHPGGGIGAHYHNYVEEMFVILSGEAEFTVDSHTSVLQAPVGAPARRGSSHAIVNHTDEPIEWMNINVSVIPGIYDAFDLGDQRTDVELDDIPQFITADLSGERLREIENYDGGQGTVQVRRALAPAVFFTPWAYFDHVVIPEGASIGPVSKEDISEVFYVMSGEGEATVSGETVAISEGYVVPAGLGEERSFSSTGTEPLELMVIGVARDMDAKLEYMASEDAAIRR